MPRIDFPDMDEVTTRTDLMNYFKKLRKAFGDLDRHLATDAGMLRAILKAQDERQGTRTAAACVRPLLWVITVLYTTRKSIALTAQRVNLNYNPENRGRARRRTVDWDK